MPAEDEPVDTAAEATALDPFVFLVWRLLYPSGSGGSLAYWLRSLMLPELPAAREATAAEAEEGGTFLFLLFFFRWTLLHGCQMDIANF